MFVDISDLLDESLSHRAANHPYLKALRDNDLPCISYALKDFAEQYYGYSLYFPRYITSAISRLEDTNHRENLLDNLTEESGLYQDSQLISFGRMGIDPEWVRNIPHTNLYKRFYSAICAATGISYNLQESIYSSNWREMLLSMINRGSPAEVVGILGLGTEVVINQIYSHLASAANYSDLSPKDTVYFALHQQGNERQSVLVEMSAEYAALPNGKSELHKGMIKALSLRCAFWDHMYERAMNFKPSANGINTELTYA